MTDNILANEIDREKLPRHIAIIMDGNGRWLRCMVRQSFLYKAGVKSVRKVTEAAAQLGLSNSWLCMLFTEME